MRFWDSSAIVPLLVGEVFTPWAIRNYEADDEVLVWWATEVECESALARYAQDPRADLVRTIVNGYDRLAQMARYWKVVEPGSEVRELACRMIRRHGLRAGDALQLAAALIASDFRPNALQFACADDRLVDAADREGFPVLRPSAV